MNLKGDSCYSVPTVNTQVVGMKEDLRDSFHISESLVSSPPNFSPIELLSLENLFGTIGESFKPLKELHDKVCENTLLDKNGEGVSSVFLTVKIFNTPNSGLSFKEALLKTPITIHLMDQSIKIPKTLHVHDCKNVTICKKKC